jgi:hypothetical protein
MAVCGATVKEGIFVKRPPPLGEGIPNGEEDLRMGVISSMPP